MLGSPIYGRWAAAALALALSCGSVGCGESPAGPTRLGVTAEDIASLLTSMSATSGALTSMTTTGGPSFPFSDVRACPAGGTMSLTGTNTVIIDRTAGRVTGDLVAVQRDSACAGPTAHGTIVVDGSLNEHTSTTNNMPKSGELLIILAMSAEMNGSMRISADGQTQSCTLSLTSIYDPKTSTIHESGDVCGSHFDHTFSFTLPPFRVP